MSTISYGSLLSRIITTLLLKVYNFIYRPDNIINLFASFDKYVWDVYDGQGFEAVFLLVQTIGIALLTTSFIVSLMDRVSEGDYSINNFFRHLLKYVMLYMVTLNCMTILRGLMDVTTLFFSSMNSQFKLEISMENGQYISKMFMAEGIKQFIGVGEKLAMFIMLLIPYLISCLFYIVLCFFAVSRVIEIILRVALAPIAIGFSFFGNMDNSDIVRYVKRTMGIFFQIVVILLISVSVTFTHNTLISSSSDSAEVVNPASVLEKDETHMTAYSYEDNKWTEIKDKDKADYVLYAYTEESIRSFTGKILDPEDYFLCTGIMLSAMFMIFKSRSISNQIFA